MGAPIFHVLFDPRAADTADASRYRDIENHYHIEMVAEGTQQLVNYQVTSLAAQAKVAASNIRAFKAIGERQEVVSGRLDDLARGIEGIQGGLDLMNDGIGALNETASASLRALREQSETLRAGFNAIAQRLLAQHKTLLDIAKILRRPLETQALELWEQADKWLTKGMNGVGGRERDDDFEDASHLLQEVIKNPIGNQDYVAWFQTGWLQWKHFRNLPEAERAFHRAVRLSAPEANDYYRLSIRHLAHMQYLQGRHEDAYQTIQRAIKAATDHDAPFDAARYAARTGRTAEAVALLDQCIDLVPATIITMFAEEDFRA